jgi:hypothetical protein
VPVPIDDKKEQSVPKRAETTKESHAAREYLRDLIRTAEFGDCVVRQVAHWPHGLPKQDSEEKKATPSLVGLDAPVSKVHAAPSQVVAFYVVIRKDVRVDVGLSLFLARVATISHPMGVRAGKIPGLGCLTERTVTPSDKLITFEACKKRDLNYARLPDLQDANQLSLEQQYQRYFIMHLDEACATAKEAYEWSIYDPDKEYTEVTAAYTQDYPLLTWGDVEVGYAFACGVKAYGDHPLDKPEYDRHLAPVPDSTLFAGWNEPHETQTPGWSAQIRQWLDTGEAKWQENNKMCKRLEAELERRHRSGQFLLPLQFSKGEYHPIQ